MILAEHLYDHQETDRVRLIEPIAPGVGVGEPLVSWKDAAQWLSQSLGGRWYWSPTGLTWVCGRRVERIVHPAYLEPLSEAQNACRDLGVEIGWTVGRCALNLLKWIGPPSYPYKGMFRKWEGQIWGYHDCRPGTWDSGIQWDIRAAYHTLWCRLPSLRVTLGRKGLVWLGMPDDERERWDRVKAVTSDCKLLRNALVGCGMGSTEKRPYYHRGEMGSARGNLGPFRPASLLVCHTCYLLTALASEEVQSVYSHTDSVVSVGGEYPQIWDDHGLVVRVQAEGETDVCTTSVYKVGPRQSSFYAAGSRFRSAVPGGVPAYDPGSLAWCVA